MDIDLYQQLLRRYWPVFLGVVGVTVLAVWLFTARATTQPTYFATQFIGVAQEPQVGADAQYQFGEYYNLQGSAFVAEFLASWLQDPATVRDVFARAGLTTPTASLRSLNRFFDLAMRGRTGFQIAVERTDEDEARELVTAAGDTIAQRFTALQQQGLYPNSILVPGDVAVGPTLPSLTLNLAIGLVAGVFLGCLALLALSLTLPRKA